jgi:hypothetical protein
MLQELREVFDNKYLSTVLTLALGLYASLLGPELPEPIKNLFNNTLFRILVLFLVVVRGNKDPKLAIMISVVFVLTLDYIHAKSATETFASINSNVYPISIATVNTAKPTPPPYVVNKKLFDASNLNHINGVITWYGNLDLPSNSDAIKLKVMGDGLKKSIQELIESKNKLNIAEKNLNQLASKNSELKSKVVDIMKEFYNRIIAFLSSNAFDIKNIVSFDTFGRSIII